MCFPKKTAVTKVAYNIFKNIYHYTKLATESGGGRWADTCNMAKEF
jgi:hypothetical protein